MLDIQILVFFLGCCQISYEAENVGKHFLCLTFREEHFLAQIVQDIQLSFFGNLEGWYIIEPMAAWFWLDFLRNHPDKTTKLIIALAPNFCV